MYNYKAKKDFLREMIKNTIEIDDEDFKVYYYPVGQSLCPFNEFVVYAEDNTIYKRLKEIIPKDFTEDTIITLRLSEKAEKEIEDLFNKMHKHRQEAS